MGALTAYRAAILGACFLIGSLIFGLLLLLQSSFRGDEASDEDIIEQLLALDEAAGFKNATVTAWAATSPAGPRSG